MLGRSGYSADNNSFARNSDAGNNNNDLLGSSMNNISAVGASPRLHLGSSSRDANRRRQNQQNFSEIQPVELLDMLQKMDDTLEARIFALRDLAGREKQLRDSVEFMRVRRLQKMTDHRKDADKIRSHQELMQEKQKRYEDKMHNKSGGKSHHRSAVRDADVMSEDSDVMDGEDIEGARAFFAVKHDLSTVFRRLRTVIGRNQRAASEKRSIMSASSFASTSDLLMAFQGRGGGGQGKIGDQEVTLSAFEAMQVVEMEKIKRSGMIEELSKMLEKARTEQIGIVQNKYFPTKNRAKLVPHQNPHNTNRNNNQQQQQLQRVPSTSSSHHQAASTTPLMRSISSVMMGNGVTHNPNYQSPLKAPHSSFAVNNNNNNNNTPTPQHQKKPSFSITSSPAESGLLSSSVNRKNPFRDFDMPMNVNNNDISQNQTNDDSLVNAHHHHDQRQTSSSNVSGDAISSHKSKTSSSSNDEQQQQHQQEQVSSRRSSPSSQIPSAAFSTVKIHNFSPANNSNSSSIANNNINYSNNNKTIGNKNRQQQKRHHDQLPVITVSHADHDSEPSSPNLNNNQSFKKETPPRNITSSSNNNNMNSPSSTSSSTQRGTNSSSPRSNLSPTGTLQPPSKQGSFASLTKLRRNSNDDSLLLLDNKDNNGEGHHQSRPLVSVIPLQQNLLEQPQPEENSTTSYNNVMNPNNSNTTTRRGSDSSFYAPGNPSTSTALPSPQVSMTASNFQSVDVTTNNNDNNNQEQRQLSSLTSLATSTASSSVPSTTPPPTTSDMHTNNTSIVSSSVIATGTGTTTRNSTPFVSTNNNDNQRSSSSIINLTTRSRSNTGNNNGMLQQQSSSGSFYNNTNNINSSSPSSSIAGATKNSSSNGGVLFSSHQQQHKTALSFSASSFAVMNEHLEPTREGIVFVMKNHSNNNNNNNDNHDDEKEQDAQKKRVERLLHTLNNNDENDENENDDESHNTSEAAENNRTANQQQHHHQDVSYFLHPNRLCMCSECLQQWQGMLDSFVNIKRDREKSEKERRIALQKKQKEQQQQQQHQNNRRDENTTTTTRTAAIGAIYNIIRSELKKKRDLERKKAISFLKIKTLKALKALDEALDAVESSARFDCFSQFSVLTNTDDDDEDDENENGNPKKKNSNGFDNSLQITSETTVDEFFEITRKLQQQAFEEQEEELDLVGGRCSCVLKAIDMKEYLLRRSAIRHSINEGRIVWQKWILQLAKVLEARLFLNHPCVL